MLSGRAEGSRGTPFIAAHPLDDLADMSSLHGLQGQVVIVSRGCTSRVRAPLAPGPDGRGVQRGLLQEDSFCLNDLPLAESDGGVDDPAQRLGACRSGRESAHRRARLLYQVS